MVALGVLAMALSTGAARAAAVDNGTPGASDEGRCSVLGKLAIDTVTITATRHAVTTGPARQGFCEIHATVAPSQDVVVRLPDTWASRYVQFGGGGFDGFLPSLDAPSSPVVASGHDLVSDGYIVAVSNGGHRREEQPDATFATDRGMTLSYASAKILDTDTVAYALAKAYYGKVPSFRYFAGCSNGGKNASVVAAYFSNRYDGVIGGDGLWGVAQDRAGGADPVGYSLKWIDTVLAGPNLTAAKGQAVVAEQLRQCDALDGLRDGIIGDPVACRRRLDLTVLRCASASPLGACLTDTDLAIINRRRSPLVIDGRVVGPAWGIDNPAGAGGPDVAIGFLAMADHSNRSLDLATLDLTAARDRLEASLDGVYHMTGDLDATARYLDHGGKLMIFHGWEDTGVPPIGSVDFFKSLQTRHPVSARNARLYMIPGMPHCRGGMAADSADLLAAMAQWVEHGITPERQHLTAWKAPADAGPADYVRRQPAQARFARPLCAFPHVARYKAGAPDKASSFVCTAGKRR